MNSTKTRNPYPDIIKGIAIVFVVLGHAIQYVESGGHFASSEYFNNWIFKFIYSFHMPLFMLVSGYFFANTIEKYSTRKLIISRLKSLLIPILVWGLIPFAFKVIKAITLHNTIGINVVKWYVSSVVYNLWFLWAILFCSAVVLIIHCLFKDSIIAYLILFVAMPFIPDILHLQLYKYMYPYFVAAYLWNRYDVFSKIKEIFYAHKCLAVIFALIVYIPLLALYNRSSYIYTTGISIYGSAGLMQIVTDIYRWIIGFAGSALILMLVYLFCNNNSCVKLKNVIAYIGKNSLGIYIISGLYFSYIALRITSHFTFNYFFIVAETIGVLAGSLGITFVIDKIPITRKLLLGGR